MKEKILKRAGIALLAIIMVVPVIYEIVIGSTLKTIKYAKLDEVIEESKSTYNMGFAVVCVSPSSEKSTKDTKKEIKLKTEEVTSPVTGEAVNAYYLDYDKLTDEERKEIFGENTKKEAYIFYVNGEKLTTLYGEVDPDNLKTYMSSYSGESMSPNLVNYKTMKDADEFKSLIKRKNDVTMAIFGTKNCYYCNQFKTIYNQVAAEEKVDIYYFDTASYDADEYKKIKETKGLKVPAACTNTSQDEDFATYDYSTPLTLFFKNGKVIDCIDGYVGKSELVEKLSSKDIEMIKSDSQDN